MHNIQDVFRVDEGTLGPPVMVLAYNKPGADPTVVTASPELLNVEAAYPVEGGRLRSWSWPRMPSRIAEKPVPDASGTLVVPIVLNPSDPVEDHVQILRDRLAQLEARVAALERPWWDRIVQRWHQFLRFLKGF